jgi:serine/threonine protein kinase
MRTKYTFRSKNRKDGYESGYESEGGTAFKFNKKIDKSEDTLAREFISDEGKTIAILSPLNKKIDFEEAHKKYQFFNLIYPGQGTQLIEAQGTYRLALPLLPGKPYHKLIFSSQEYARIVFLSAVQALKDCHEKDIILIDLKEDNILFDEASGKSYLIDGGTAVPIGEMIDPVFQKSSQFFIDSCRIENTSYAPECFSFERELATEAMDIYSLGSMMVYTAGDLLGPELLDLAKACQNEDPRKRPNLEELEEKLIQLADLTQERVAQKKKGIDDAIQIIKSMELSAKGNDIETDINSCIVRLKTQLNTLFTSINRKDLPIYRTYREKNAEIDARLLTWEQRKTSLTQLNFNKHLEHFKQIADEIADENSIINAFYNQLEVAKFAFLESNKTNHKAKQIFQIQCEAAIEEVKPLLENHRTLGELIIKFIVEVLEKITCGLTTTLGFFVPKSTAAAELDLMQEELLTINL